MLIFKGVCEFWPLYQYLHHSHIQSYIIHIPETQTTLGLIGKDLSDFDGPAEATIQRREGCEILKAYQPHPDLYS